MKALFCVLLCVSAVTVGAAPKQHPRLLLTPESVATLRANLGNYPLFDAAVAEARESVELAMGRSIQVPVPRDAAGETHERHKRNYLEMQQAGVLYQLTGDLRYARFVRDVLEAYAQLYPTIGIHPAAKSSAPGRLFHQMLNETVWLVNTTQAYDCVYETLTAAERTRFEQNVFRPMVRYFTVDRARELDRIHNHGTWSATAVGMAGYVMGDPDLVAMALHGTNRDGTGGYLRQLEELYSPDGYYCEGPYYARYAIAPFYLFAEVLQNNEPELKIFERRDHLLRKALYATLQQTAANGAFIPFNDALKEKDIRSPEIVFALGTAFTQYEPDPRLLSVAHRQGSVNLGRSGLAIARALAENQNPPPLPYASLELSDGPKGTTGGVALLRPADGGNATQVVFKYTAFGMEHGHYDKLGLIYYDQGLEILPDYGSARFLNVDQKDGGRYLKENATFAKQTIAHNTVTVDEQSAYGGKYDNAEHQYSERLFFNVSNPDFQYVSAVDRTAYPGVLMQRTVALVRDPALRHPVVVDVYRLESEQPHRYDMAYYYRGTFLETNVPLQKHVAERRVLGSRAGYQHLWVAAEGKTEQSLAFTWMAADRYYTLSSATSAALQVYFVQAGANDPHFNLRPENAIVLRADTPGAHVFASVIEPHGHWNGVKEQTSGGRPTVQQVQVLAATRDGTVVRVTGASGLSWTVMIASAHVPRGGALRIEAGGQVHTWDGEAALRR